MANIQISRKIAQIGADDELLDSLGGALREIYTYSSPLPDRLAYRTRMPWNMHVARGKTNTNRNGTGHEDGLLSHLPLHPTVQLRHPIPNRCDRLYVRSDSMRSAGSKWLRFLGVSIHLSARFIVIRGIVSRFVSFCLPFLLARPAPFPSRHVLPKPLIPASPSPDPRPQSVRGRKWSCDGS